jgi:hypothetical protein
MYKMNNSLSFQAECEAVPNAPYQQRINKVIEQIPIKALGGRLLTEGSLPNANSSSGEISSGLPTGEAAAAPGNKSLEAGNGTGSETSDGFVTIPGKRLLFGTSESRRE